MLCEQTCELTDDMIFWIMFNVIWFREFCGEGIGIFLPESPWHIKESEFGELKQSLLWEQLKNRECTQSLLFHGVMGR